MSEPTAKQGKVGNGESEYRNSGFASPIENGRSPLFDRLSIRFALVLALALLPLGVAALYQTSQLQQEIIGRTEEALLGETLQVATPEVMLIQQARGLVAGLAKALAVWPGDAGCLELMQNAQTVVPAATLVGFFPTSGQMLCSSTGKDFDFKGNALFESIRDQQRPNFVVNRFAPVSGTSVLGISHPVFDENGIYQGYVSISLPHSGLQQLSSSQGNLPDTLAGTLSFLTFDRDGEVLTASSGLDNAQFELPSDRALTDLIGTKSTVFQAISKAGALRSFAVVPIVADELYLLSTWEPSEASTVGRYGASLYILPVVMWAVGLIVAGWASEYLVSRHIRVLNRSMAGFAKGDRRLRQNIVKHAPTELKALGESFEAMSESITLGEAELEDSIHQKEVLLREVHHRVKNNLQLIASIINMQRRQASAPESKLLLKGLQDRIISLATIHRGLYQTSGLADVRADELFRDILRQITRLALDPNSTLSVSADLDPLHMTPDQAVPLSLFLAEALTNAMKYAGAPTGATPVIYLSLKRTGEDQALLELQNSLPDAKARHHPSDLEPELASNSSGLGSQLLIAFAQQVGGQLETGVADNSYRVMLRFTLRALQEAENRQSDPADPEPAIE